MGLSIDIEQYIAVFEQFGGTAESYLRTHFPRYIATQQRLLSHWNRGDGVRILDVGAHWLHQSLLYAIDGFEVSALDVPVTFDSPEVAALAEAHRIRLLRNPNLERPTGLAEIADDSFDLILFTEIIEHLAFNPVAMWRELYRVLRPGGRIVLTTPNYYALRRLLRHAARFARGHGGGVDGPSVLRDHTFSHHWKNIRCRNCMNISRFFRRTLFARGVALSTSIVTLSPGAFCAEVWLQSNICCLFCDPSSIWKSSCRRKFPALSLNRLGEDIQLS